MIVIQSAENQSTDPFYRNQKTPFLVKFIVVTLIVAMFIYIIPQGFLFFFPGSTQKPLSGTAQPSSLFDATTQTIIELDQKSLFLILQAYNAGPGKVHSYRGVIRYPETMSYVERAFNLLGESSLPTPYNHIIEEVAPYFGIDPHLVKTIVLLESGGEPHHTSSQGARGLMQVTRSTWEDMTEQIGVNWSFDKAFDPYKNIVIGCAYLQWLRDNFLDRMQTQV